MGQELVSVIGNISGEWRPSFGPEAQAILQRALPDERARDGVKQEAMRIMARCVDPQGTALRNTGLVVGYVQSGKTLSFTTVAALARDNGYQMVILITGTSNSLNEQSEKRLRRDLGLEEGSQGWRHFSEPGIRDRAALEAILKEWDEPDLGDERRTVLITLKKNSTRLKHLVALLKDVSLGKVPTLIIDDEADHAGLNNKVRTGRVSTVYARLTALRDILPHHSYLQYTATPQGPLFISLIDQLSPNFAEVLQPGGDYTGGRAFFGDLADPRLIVPVPQGELPKSALGSVAPPDTLVRAMRLFFLGVAIGRLRGEHRGKRRRSMMVHPSQRVPHHDGYVFWVKSLKRTFEDVLGKGGDPRDKEDLLRTFEASYNELRATNEELEPFVDITPHLYLAVLKTEVALVNSTDDAQKVVWGESYSWILIGGQSLDRGFTVEGITITYMPRGLGQGNADTVQQRARFFGYHRPYLGLCRVFLDRTVEDAFRAYVDHEEHVRRALIESRKKGESLHDLRRTFVLDPILSPTRSSILPFELSRIDTRGWNFQKMPHETQEKIKGNRSRIEALVKGISDWEETSSWGSHSSFRQRIAVGVPLKAILESFLADYEVEDAGDSRTLYSVIVAIREYLLGHPEATCAVVQMDPEKSRLRGISRRTGRVEKLHQGPSENKDETKGPVYPGDGEIRGDNDPVTLQLYSLNVTETTGANAREIAKDVPTIAIWLSDEVAEPIVTQ